MLVLKGETRGFIKAKIINGVLVYSRRKLYMKKERNAAHKAGGHRSFSSHLFFLNKVSLAHQSTLAAEEEKK